MNNDVHRAFLTQLSAILDREDPDLVSHHLAEAVAEGRLTGVESSYLQRLQHELERNERREFMLGLLLESAREIAKSDFEQALASIVRRARVLLDAEMAYVSLNDHEQGETFIRTTEGVRTEGYRKIRMPLGSGVLGKVAAGDGPFQSRDYLNDAEIEHSAEVDRRVEAEGVQSILGAPLEHEGTVIGALLVADRRIRSFSAEEQWMLESLSSYATIALTNSRLITHLQEAVAERDALEFDRARSLALLERARRTEASLAQLILAGGTMTDVLTAIAQEWRIDGAIVGPDGHLVENGLHSGDHLPDTAAILSALDVSRTQQGSFAPVTSDEPYGVIALVSRNRLLGGLLVRGELSNDEAETLTRAAMFLGLLLLLSETRSVAGDRVDEEVIRLLVDATPGLRDEARSRGQRAGLPPDTPLSVLVIDAARGRRRALNAIRPFAKSRGALCALQGDQIVVISAEELCREIVGRLRQVGVPGVVGHSHGATLEHGVPWHFNEARDAAAAGRVLGVKDPLVDRATLGIVGMLMSSARREAVDSLIDDAVGDVLRYDLERGTQLTETLWQFFLADCHHARAAEALHVHLNTLRQRLSRVRHLIGPRWETHGGKSEVYLALRLWRLRDADLLRR